MFIAYLEENFNYYFQEYRMIFFQQNEFLLENNYIVTWLKCHLYLFFLVPYEISESELLKDLVYVFQGIEGKWIKFDPFSDAYRVNSQVSIIFLIFLKNYFSQIFLLFTLNLFI